MMCRNCGDNIPKHRIDYLSIIAMFLPAIFFVGIYWYLIGEFPTSIVIIIGIVSLVIIISGKLFLNWNIED
jgi:uncharacterized membrane protein YphA (DoxX/SURF4 family)